VNLLESLRWIQRRYAGVGRKTLTFGGSEVDYNIQRKGMLVNFTYCIKEHYPFFIIYVL